MKIKTIEKLQELLDADLAWRKKELIELHTLIHSAKNPVYVRAGMALLCAHFEGFIKVASNYYIVFVSSQNLVNNVLKKNFMAMQLKSKLIESAKSEKTSVHKSLLEVIDNKAGENFRMRYSEDNPIVSTESNPSSNVFEEIVYSLGLDFFDFETKRNYIDSDLLSNRHKIVHGNKLFLTDSDFDGTFNNILWIIEKYKNNILDAALSKKYLV